MKKAVLVFAIAAYLLLAGCTANLTLVPQDITVAGQPHHYVFATGRDVNGGSFNVMDRFTKDGTLEAENAAMNPGILPALFNGAVGSAVMGAEFIGAAAVLRPSNNINTNSGGASATGGSAKSFQKQTATGGQGGSSTIQKGAVTNNVDVF